MSERFNVLMCKFYIFAVVGITIELLSNLLLNRIPSFHNVNTTGCIICHKERDLML